jgi:CheY-like chemotaxis protein
MVTELLAREASCCPGESLHVLVVEDNPDAADSLAMFLRSSGHRVDVARDGPEALQAVDVGNPDVVLLDLGLPRLEDGLEVARQIKHWPTAKHPLLVAITGFDHNADQLRSLDAGVDLYLVKPVDPSKLLDFIGRYNQG